MVGIVDPPRPEAKAAIAEAREAGIRVRMITGDHAVTAAAIAKELGIPGRAITGQEFAAMSDEQLLKEIDDIGVVARVAPEHKVRLVKILQGRGEIVAMTGDGVNDAPALKTSNIGVAMGITGTEASKEAAAMILTDDNFATIVKAVELGRTIYDNLLKYIRFQLAQLVGFIVTFLGSALLNIAGGIPFLPGQILWINFLVDAPPGAALGMDKASAGLMERKPRPAHDSIIDRKLAVWLGLGGITMAVVTLGIMAYAESRGDDLALVRTLGLRHLLDDAPLCRDLVSLPEPEHLFHGDLQQLAAQLVAVVCVRGDLDPDGNRLLAAQYAACLAGFQHVAPLRGAGVGDAVGQRGVQADLLSSRERYGMRTDTVCRK